MKARFALVLVLVAALLLAQSALAKGTPDKVTISGADLPHEIVITGDEDALNTLGLMELEDYDTLTSDAPEGISGDGYLITRFYGVRGDYVPFDQVRYYPDPAGGRGYVQYVGVIGGSSTWDGKWLRATPAGEATLQRVIADAKGEASADEQSAAPPLLNAFFHALAALVAAQ